MAHIAAASGQCLRYSPAEGRLQPPHQLTSSRSPLPVQRLSSRCWQRPALVSCVAVPLPAAQPESPARRLRRTSSENFGKAVQLIRSLSSKFASAPEAVVQQVRAALDAPFSSNSAPLKRQTRTARPHQRPATLLGHMCNEDVVI